MTIAIGTHFAQGVILCADTKFVDDNGGISYGSKLEYREGRRGNVVAIAHAANDSNAAKMLSTEILASVTDCHDQADLETAIKQTMTQWQADYGQSPVPFQQFIVVFSLAGKTHVYLCQPPNIVIPALPGRSAVAGSAVKIVETLLPVVLDKSSEKNRWWDAESTLLKLAYLMKRAKSEDLYAGGDTEAIVIKNNGSYALTWPEEMKDAEQFSEALDSLFCYCCHGFFSMRSTEDQNIFLERFSELFHRHLKDASESVFYQTLADL